MSGIKIEPLNSQGRLDIMFGSMFSGKCLKKGTRVLCYDKSIKAVENLKDGDFLFGDDSCPRRVANLHNGFGKLYKVTPKSVFAEPYTVNENHILTLCLSETFEIIHCDSQRQITTLKCLQNHQIVVKEFNWSDFVSPDALLTAIDNTIMNIKGDIIDIDIVSYLASSEEWKQLYRGYQVAIDFDYQAVITKPFQLGKLLVDAESTIKNIPVQYLHNSRDIRQELLNGIIDSVGKKFQVNCVSLAKDIQFLIRSLGYKCNVVDRTIHFSLEKDLTTEITVIEDGCGEYFGFTVDANHRFLLKDFTVTHNSSAMLRKLSQLAEMGLAVLYINHGIDNRAKTMYSTHCPLLKDQTFNITTIKSSELQSISKDYLQQFDVIGIDEAQFFDETLIDFVRELVDFYKKYVLVVGLDGTFRREKFGHILDLVPLADNVTKLHAFCRRCKINKKLLKTALFTHYTPHETNPASTVIVGGADTYEPVCRECYLELNKGHAERTCCPFEPPLAPLRG